MRRVLVVDGDPAQRNALRIVLTRYLSDGGARVEAFAQPQEALARGREVGFAVAIADYRLPSTNGIAFLKQMRTLGPDTVSIMLVTSSDYEAVIAPAKEAGIFRVIAKPWTIELEGATRGALAEHRNRLARRMGDERIASGRA